MAKTVGLTFLNIKAFCDEQMGKGAWQRVLDTLTEVERRELAGVVGIGWYDLGLYCKTMRQLDKVFGKGDLALIPYFARFEAERDLNMFFRVLLRAANPAYVVEQSSRVWPKYHDTGTLTVKRDDRHATATLAGWGVVDPALCLELDHYFKRAVELAGARGVELAHVTCRNHGAEVCTFDVRWR